MFDISQLPKYNVKVIEIVDNKNNLFGKSKNAFSTT